MLRGLALVVLLNFVLVPVGNLIGVHWVPSLIFWVLASAFSLGSLLCIFIQVPLRWWEESRIETPLTMPGSLTCPITGVHTDSLKQINLPTQLFFIGIAAYARRSEVVGSPEAVRDVIKQTVRANLLTGNLLTVAMLPFYLVLFVQTYTEGHSPRLFAADYGFLGDKARGSVALAVS